jgi:hypothetical protein
MRYDRWSPCLVLVLNFMLNLVLRFHTEARPGLIQLYAARRGLRYAFCPIPSSSERTIHIIVRGLPAALPVRVTQISKLTSNVSIARRLGGLRRRATHRAAIQIDAYVINGGHGMPCTFKCHSRRVHEEIDCCVCRSPCALFQIHADGRGTQLAG